MQNEEIVSLINTQARILHLPDTISYLEGRDGARTAICRNDGRSLIPSIPRKKDGAPTPTKVSASYWAHAQKNAQVRSWMKLGWLKVLDEDAPGIDEIDSLSGQNPKTAMTLIEVEESRTLLAEWLSTESREPIKAAIAARIETLAGKTLKPLVKK